MTLDSLVISSGWLTQSAADFGSPDGRVWFGYAGTSGNLLVNQTLYTEMDEPLVEWELIDLENNLDRVRVSWDSQHGLLQEFSNDHWNDLQYVTTGSSLLSAVVSANSRLRVTEGESGAVPTKTRLYPASPNPFNPQTMISFDVVHAGFYRLVIYDLLGREVRVLQEGDLDAGFYSQAWSGNNDQGIMVASGVYFASLIHSNLRISIKLVLIK